MSVCWVGLAWGLGWLCRCGRLAQNKAGAVPADSEASCRVHQEACPSSLQRAAPRIRACVDFSCALLWSLQRSRVTLSVDGFSCRHGCQHHRRWQVIRSLPNHSRGTCYNYVSHRQRSVLQQSAGTALFECLRPLEWSACVLTRACAACMSHTQIFNRDLSIACVRLFDRMRRKEARPNQIRRMKYRRACLDAEKTGKPKPEPLPSVDEATYVGDDIPGLRILEALAASGLRSIRYFKEIPVRACAQRANPVLFKRAHTWRGFPIALPCLDRTWTTLL